MDEITAIKLLRTVLLGEKKAEIPPTSVQIQKKKQSTVPPARVAPPVIAQENVPTRKPISTTNNPDDSITSVTGIQLWAHICAQILS